MVSCWCGAPCAPDQDREISVVPLTEEDDPAAESDQRELRDYLERWLEEHPDQPASKLEVIDFVQSFMPPGARADTALIEILVDALNTNADGGIDFREAAVGLSSFLRGSLVAKINLIFFALDANGIGKVTEEQFVGALRLQLEVAQAEGTAAAENAGLSGAAAAIFDRDLTLPELKQLVKAQAELRRHFSLGDEVTRFNESGLVKAQAEQRAALDAIAEALGFSAPPLDKAEAAARSLGLLGLDPFAVASLLGGKDEDDFVANCLARVLEGLELVGTTVDEALRRMSRKLRLSGEHPEIDRILRALAKEYCRVNPAVLANEDVACLVFFAVVRMNANLHNPAVKAKMTREQFVRSVPEGARRHIKRGFLESVFTRVQNQELQLGTPSDLINVRESTDVFVMGERQAGEGTARTSEGERDEETVRKARRARPAPPAPRKKA